MKLHSNGQHDYLKELKKQQEVEIKEVNEGELSKSKKLNLIQKIRAKFNQLIKGSDQSLYIVKSTEN